MIPVLIKAIQEQNVHIQRQEKELEKLREYLKPGKKISFLL